MNVCRLCLAKDANFSLMSASLAIRIMACTSLEIEPGDGLPQRICPSCRLRLEEFHHFRRQCQMADRSLRSRKGTPHQEVLEQEEVDMVLTGSESNAQWRQQAAKLIRTEIDAYKKEVLATCKQTVRSEIEAEVRQELEEMLLVEAKRQLRLNVLDDLFSELERFFVRKRNETAFEQVDGSGSYCSEFENSSAITPLGNGFYEAEEQVGREDLLETVDISMVELFDDELETTTAPNTEALPPRPPPVSASMPVLALPMVEINMSDPQLSHLRQEFNREAFLEKQKLKNPKKDPPKDHPSPCQKKVRFESATENPVKSQTKVQVQNPKKVCIESPKKMQFESPKRVKVENPKKGSIERRRNVSFGSPILKAERHCRRHSSSKRPSDAVDEWVGCVRCRLRGSDKLNLTTS
ncbi:hypothetical protein KR009_000208 [Drosophila setifemur]|nr:hypothetical protein KR009_000208 [Drosophila setifemur]